MMELREQIDNAARDVAKANNLTGHGQNSFKKMVRAVFDRVESSIAASVDDQVSKKVQAERERITTILDAPEAKDREDTALRLALDSDMPAGKAIGLLAATPKARPQGPTPLDIAMQSETGTVGADDGAGGDYGPDHEVDVLASRILNAGGEAQ